MKKYILFLLLIVPVLAIAQGDTTVVEVPVETVLPAWVKIALGILGGVSVFLGGAYLFIRSKAAKLKTALHETGNIFGDIEAATVDNNVSEDEFKGVVKQGKKAWEAIKNIFEK